MNTPWFKVLYTLFRRELREHRLLFLYLPAACTLLACLGFTLGLVQTTGPSETFLRNADGAPRLFNLDPEDLPPDVAEQFMRAMQQVRETWYSQLLEGIYQGAEIMMLLAFWTSMAYYYLNTLYQPRKDRSILFWNSLPVSDAQTIASKLLAGLVGCHLVYMLCFAAFDLFMLLSVRAWVGITGTEGFVGYLRDTGPFANALVSLAKMPVNILWALPVYTWLLLASAWPREAPFAWATGPWVVVILAEVALTEKSLVFNKLVEHLLPLNITRLNEGDYPAPELMVASLLGVFLIAAAIRFNRSDAN